MAPARKRQAVDVDAVDIFEQAKRVAAKTSSGAKPGGAAVSSLWELMDSDNGWKKKLLSETQKPYFKTMADFVAKERETHQVFPPAEHTFAAFNTTHFDKVKVVIIGQDPYHDDNQAHGLCFSVLPGVKTPPSLRNMYTELATDISGFKAPNHGYLLSWAKQGVLMLNATLTVQAHKANSHAKCGWQTFTDAAIKAIAEQPDPVVFLLWGGFAQKKAKLINKVAPKNKHVIIQSAHPSPLSVTKWRGCATFSKANTALKDLGKDEIDWTLPADVKAE
eukprot:TRINITY_DN1698_c0_g1_i1.p1 TRINITY_DN1698_c0_g1~~TRINITY_DN1698_c0_g1_i1.p1  ORF type:complete len:277 (+),score=127.19 TRINITY_DN1698_c0_g1_i1:88-918(+)